MVSRFAPFDPARDDNPFRSNRRLMASGPRARLKKLAQEIPPMGEVRKLLLALEMENTPLSDYAIALIGASLVERTLQASIEARFIRLTEDEQRRLFSYEHRGPLADFSARIKIGYAMGAFGPNTRDDLEHIRHIRNLFAHAPSVMRFSIPEIAEACEFAIIKKLRIAEGGSPEDARSAYSAACMAIARRLHIAITDDRLNVEASRHHRDLA
jgi:hypothetical protein